jgi:thioredoxin reductase (NADPH)
MIYDTIIIGAGPAGLTAGIYAARAGFSALVFEKLYPGGQIAKTDTVENYPGINTITGVELAMQLANHADEAGAKIESAEILKIEMVGDVKKVYTENDIYEAKTLILATGANPRKLGLESELRLAGRGVSYCATCDGNFFRGKEVAVIGGGDSAVEEALYLSNLASKVYIVHRRDEFRAKQFLVDKVTTKENIEVIWDSNLLEVTGESMVDGIKVKNKKTEEERLVPLSGVFIAVGIIPESDFVKDLIKVSDDGYVLIDDQLQTNIPGVFAAGDVRKKLLRQIVTATSDGAICVTSIERYLNEQ